MFGKWNLSISAPSRTRKKRSNSQTYVGSYPKRRARLAHRCGTVPCLSDTEIAECAKSLTTGHIFCDWDTAPELAYSMNALRIAFSDALGATN
jgi:hypothetical protein